MFARNKNNDGFEWHKYVRTAIKVKREQRRQKVRDAGHAASVQVGAAGTALLAGSKAAGAALWAGARAAVGTLWLLLLGLWNVLLIAGLHAADKSGLVLMALGAGIGRAARPLVALLAGPRIGAGVALAAALALGAGLSRYRSAGLDREAAITFAVAAVLIIASLPLLSRLTGLRLPRLPSLRFNPRLIGAVVLASVVGSAGYVLLRPGFGSFNLAGVAARLPLVGSEPLQGRAQVLGGDRLRIGTTTVRLSGVELPEPTQLCGKPGGRQFRCGGLGAAALGRLIGASPVRCTLDGTDSAGVALARCMRGDKEINAELVRQGQAFAESGLVLTRYASEEKEARTAKAGIWAGGESLRPAEWRAKLWEEAKRKAPAGCPIKGVVMGNAKLYLLPWSSDYDRGRVQPNRGERWFCSESEAVNAGWKAAPVRG